MKNRIINFGWLLLSLTTPLLADHLPTDSAVPSTPDAQFMATVQFAVHESNPELLRRSQKVLVEQFGNTIEGWPDLKKRKFETRTVGNEVVFSMVSPNDMQGPMQDAVFNLIQSLSGRVPARGRFHVYRTALSQPMGGYIDISVDDTHSKVLSISAQNVPLRDLLKELMLQLGSLSYLIPGDCASQPVDWSFGEGENPKPKDIDSVMTELATFFGMKSEKRTGTYIFTGSCPNVHRVIRRHPPSEMLRSSHLLYPTHPNEGSLRRQVFFPLSPMGE